MSNQNLLLKYNVSPIKQIATIKVLYSTIKIVGILGVVIFTCKYKNVCKNQILPKFYYIRPTFTQYLSNSFIISNLFINSFLMDIVKLLFGVNYGWFFSFNIAGRGFSFRLKKKTNLVSLKIKIGYSHFVFIPVDKQILVKIAKKRNKLILFSLNFWILSKLVWQLRNLRSKHTYKIQGIFFFNEKIKVKPGKKKQI